MYIYNQLAMYFGTNPYYYTIRFHYISNTEDFLYYQGKKVKNKPKKLKLLYNKKVLKWKKLFK